MEFFRGLMYSAPIVIVLWAVGFAIAYGVSKLF